MAKVVTLNPIDPFTFEYQDYSAQDDNLIVNFTIEPTFNPLQNYVAYFIYDLNNTVIFDNEVNFDGYNIIDGQVVLNPEGDVEKAGYEEGQYNVVYNFLNNELSSSFFQRLYVDQISPDRTEIRLNTTQISNLDLINGANSLITQIQNSVGIYFDFFLNFGDNQLIIANNILLDTSNSEDPTVLIKLYEPLPINFNLKDECWVVTEVASTVAYNVNITQTFELVDENVYLKGPNLNLNVKDQINNSTAYTNYATLSSSSYATGSNNLQYQVNSILAERGVEINVDYSDYSNFIYFSSALTRLENFYYKLQLIEEYSYSASLSNLAGTGTYVVTSKNIWEEKINEIITTFDGYDYYLYYSSGSAAWPKTNSVYPYNNATTDSVAGLTFIQSQSLVAADYDENNNNALINAIPTYLREDSANAQYELFIEMLGEMFDNIWIYYQDVTEKWNADNRLQYGVSKDIVADVLRDLGLKIYQSSFGSADLYTALLGVTPSGSDFPFPYMTGSLPTPIGFEYINSSISASNGAVPLEDIEKGTYKRLYHNLPLLLKKKGTTVGIQDLITVYGIPSTILRVAEFGGKDKDESNDWDYYKQRYNYKFDTRTNGWIQTEWALNSDWGVTPAKSLEFRFKTPGLNSALSFVNQSLWSLDDGSLTKIVLEYTGSGYASGSYSGSIANPYNEYANLKLIIGSDSASVYLPFFDGDWWSVGVTVDHSNGSANFTLYAANNIYNGNDGSTIGFIASSSVNTSNSTWNAGATSYFPSDSRNNIGKYRPFTGSYQEIRYYTEVITDSLFRDYTMNPDSVESTSTDPELTKLAFRASLGGELYTGSVSIHPKVTGSWVATSSFASDSNFTVTGGDYTSNTETVYLDQPAAGIKNIISNKIQVVDMNLPSGSTLSQYRSIQQQPPGGSTYTENLAYTEVAFSPQNEINDDIMDQLGFFNMGDYIGDPRQRFNQDTSYPDLDKLRNAYFEKYTGNYDLNDYIRLIKFFDNSLFKMIKDFTPARASLASGVVVKQTLLERNKYPQPEVEWAKYDYSGSINTAFISGGAGGSVNKLNSLDTNPYYLANGLSNNYGLTQSWVEEVTNPYGLAYVTRSSQEEFYNGEYKGSTLTVENGELNEANPYKNPSITPLFYDVTVYDSRNVSSNSYLSTFFTIPGELSIWYEEGPPPSPSPDPIFIPPGLQYGPTYAQISYTDKNGVYSRTEIFNMSTFTLIVPSTSTPRTFRVTSVTDSGGIRAILTLVPDGGTVTNNDSDTDVLVSIEPYLPEVFVNSDYNALINNSELNRQSQFIQQVDYTTDQLVPVNFAQIISGSAFLASIPDSNYTMRKHIYPRYVGSKNTTDDFNIASVSNANSIEIQQNVDLGNTQLGLPSVDLNRTYFAYFNWAGGTAPEWGNIYEDKTTYNLRYIIDENGNIIRPLNDSTGINLGIINQNFTENTTAVSALTNTNIFGTNLSILNGSYNIFKSGKTIQPILYSQTQSYDGNGNVLGYGFTSSINFNIQLGTTGVTNFAFSAYKTSAQNYTSTFNTLITFPNESFDYTTAYDTGTSIYTFTQNTNVEVSFVVNLRTSVSYAYDPSISPAQKVNPTFAIQRSTDGGTTWNNLTTGGAIFSKTSGGVKTITMVTPFQNFNQNDQVRVVSTGYVINPNDPTNPTATINISATNTYFTNKQAQGGFTVPTASVTPTQNYWETGSVTSTVLTASLELTNLYGYYASGIEDSGFSSINYPFTIQPYDEIRFEAIEPNAYTIVSASLDDRLYLYLDKAISPTGSNANFFLIRRYVDDPAFIVLDVDKPAGDSGEGILKPEYIAGRVEGKIDQILENLQERGLISPQ
jgi:hypothetical protein